LSYEITFFKKSGGRVAKFDRLVHLTAPLLFNLDVRNGWSLMEDELDVYIFFERKCGRGSLYSDFVFLKIRTQIRVYGDLNLGGWVVHPLP
jgi:hypothetical protein